MTDITTTLGTTDSGTPFAKITDIRDVAATCLWPRPAAGSTKGDAAAIAAALAKAGKLSAAQVRAVEHAIEYAIRHAGYYASAPGRCAVDFDSIELYAYNVERGGTVFLAYSGLAHVNFRGKSGRFMVAYDHGMAIGKRGGFRTTRRDGSRVEGAAAIREMDYFGRGA